MPLVTVAIEGGVDRFRSFDRKIRHDERQLALLPITAYLHTCGYSRRGTPSDAASFSDTKLIWETLSRDKAKTIGTKTGRDFV